jgi:hypothetical protein
MLKNYRENGADPCPNLEIVYQNMKMIQTMMDVNSIENQTGKGIPDSPQNQPPTKTPVMIPNINIIIPQMVVTFILQANRIVPGYRNGIACFYFFHCSQILLLIDSLFGSGYRPNVNFKIFETRKAPCQCQFWFQFVTVDRKTSNFLTDPTWQFTIADKKVKQAI